MPAKPLAYPEIDHIEQNLVLAQGHAEAWYRVFPWSWDEAPEAEQEERLRTLSNLFSALAHLKVGLVVVPREHSPGQHLVVETQDDPILGEAARMYAAAAQAMLSAGKRATEYLHFLRVRLPGTGNQMPPGSLLKTVLQAPRRAGSVLAGYGKEWTIATIMACQKAEQEIYEIGSAEIACRRAQPVEIEWLIRRNLWRGIGEPVLRGRAPAGHLVNGPLGPVLVPHREAILTMMDSYVKRELTTGYITLQQMVDGQPTYSYPAFLAVSHLPDDVVSPGFEFMFEATQMSFPVEGYIWQDGKDHVESAEGLRQRKGELDDQKRHCDVHGAAVPGDALEVEDELEALQRSIAAERTPLLNATYVFCLCGSSPTERDTRVRLFKNRLKELGIEVQFPRGIDQWHLFVQVFPGSQPLVDAYVQKALHPQVAAATMPFATSALGDPGGWPVGLVGPLRGPVYLDMTRPARENYAPAWLITGDPGSGKSAGAKRAVAAHAATRGSAQKPVCVFHLDPKQECGAIALHLKELQGQVGVYKLDHAHRGVLDPYRLFPRDRGSAGEAGVRMQLAASVCLSLLGRHDAETEAAVMTAVMETETADNPCMGEVVRRLENKNRDLASLLHTYTLWPMSGLMFADTDTQYKSVNMDHRWNILQFPSLSLPQEGTSPSEWSSEERIAHAVLQCMVCLAWSFAMSRPGALKVLILDEYHILQKTAAGRALGQRLLRMSRTYNAFCICITQGVADIDETEAGLFTAVSVFRTANADNAAAALRLLRMDVTDGNVRLLASLRKASDAEGRTQEPQCLHRDLDGRRGVMSIPTPVPSWERAFDTRPQAREEAERILGDVG